MHTIRPVTRLEAMTEKKTYEDELINRFVKADNTKAFEELMSLYQDRIFRFGPACAGTGRTASRQGLRTARVSP